MHTEAALPTLLTHMLLPWYVRLIRDLHTASVLSAQQCPGKTGSPQTEAQRQRPQPSCAAMHSESMQVLAVAGP